MAARITPEKTDAPAQAPPATSISPAPAPRTAASDEDANLPELPKITGGGIPGEQKIVRLGKWFKVRVIDLLDPEAVNSIPVAIYTQGFEWKETVRTGVVCVLPLAAIRMLQKHTTQRTTQRIAPGSPLYRNEEAVMRSNPTAEIVYRGSEMYLVKERKRFSIEILEDLGAPPQNAARGIRG
jgi:hypothetical protein